ncbi:MAG TPA: signal peptidase I [Candidatus Limnocylindria bacterium]
MRILRFILLGLLTTTALVLLGTTKLYPTISGQATVTIVGPSMGNTLPIGSLAYVEPAADYRVGDIVTFLANRSYVTHRIVADASGNGDFWVTQGDANATPDAVYIRSDQILGRATFHLPYLGLARDIVASPVVLGFLVLLTILLLYGDHLIAPQAHRPAAKA